MKTPRKIFTALFLLSLTIIATSIPTVLAHASQARADGPPPLIDWQSVLVQILSFVIPILVTALTTQAIYQARYWANRLKLERPDLLDLFTQAAKYATPIVEQLRKNGTIPDNATAKRHAMELARRWLIFKGVNAQAQETYLHFLDDAIEAAVLALGQTETTIDVTQLYPGSAVSAVEKE